MFINTHELTSFDDVQADLCIVGGGAAGITMALEAIGKGRSVAVLESGGLELDAAAQELSWGSSVGVKYFPMQVVSTRMLGGNSNRWGSWCRPFDETDFQKREWVPHSGWPITRAELDPFYARAHPWARLRDYNYTPEYLLAGIDDPKFQLYELPGTSIVTKLWQFHKPPVRFGIDHQDAISREREIRIYLKAPVVELEMNESGDAVTAARVQTLSGKQFKVRAKAFVVALGGMENPRLLLSSRSVQKNGVGNQNDIVGRFFMEHPHLHQVGMVLANDASRYPALYNTDSQYERMVVGGFCPSADFQATRRILNGSITMRPSRRMFAQSSMSDGFMDSIGGIMNDVLEAPGKIYDRVRVKLGGKREILPERMVLDVSTRTEQTPNPDSRITLSDERDALGMPRIKLDWRLTGLDGRTVHTLHEEFARAIGASGKGRFRIESDTSFPADSANWSPSGPYGNVEGGWHHMGTTRMADDPKHGVVDRDCKVHGVGNLYVAGASVFCTSGFANPTLTLLALSLRLSDHLHDRILA